LGTKLVYHYTQWKNIEPDFVVGITGFTDKKIRTILAYSSCSFMMQLAKEPGRLYLRISWKVLITVQRDLGRLAG
jgi:hypothetical protein